MKLPLKPVYIIIWIHPQFFFLSKNNPSRTILRTTILPLENSSKENFWMVMDFCRRENWKMLWIRIHFFNLLKNQYCFANWKSYTCLNPCPQNKLPKMACGGVTDVHLWFFLLLLLHLAHYIPKSGSCFRILHTGYHLEGYYFLYTTKLNRTQQTQHLFRWLPAISNHRLLFLMKN